MDHRVLIGLANHGGGFFVFGFAETASGLVPATPRPADLRAYTSDTVNSVVSAYAEPIFHCEVSIVTDPSGGAQYPIVTVPGGHRAPIKARRDGPNGQIVKQSSYYIRRPGPQTEVPQNGREWDALVHRCMMNAREDMLQQFRAIMSGGIGTEGTQEQIAPVARWFDESKARWTEVISRTPPGAASRLPNGYFAVGYQLSGALTRVTAAGLLDALNTGQVRHTGWPLFVMMTRPENRPYISGGDIECWVPRNGEDHGAGHSDFWRASPDGKFFNIRGYQEDEERNRRRGANAFDITVPTWRVGEALLHAANMAQQLGDPSAEVAMIVEWSGLNGRELTHMEGTRLIFGGHTSQQDVFRNTLTVRADQISDALPELVGQLAGC